ncbi:alpha/beta-hydrolase [Parathielavia hyrcaniae]|uniref:Alpha/beta-hydrolase n=1 Tax=Parathielavia hyrcaniae TaxID=113614 RepID=A0AAN6Q0D0_9PEZI|nr:alpha/beta-hydrolase [Parathielavia hyrcaniae]
MTPFGPVHILEPSAEHTNTIILLHGRGSNGEEFAEELLEAKLSSGETLQEQLPTWRWVFPSSPELWSTAFEDTMPAWFEAHSLTDPTARQELQMAGIRDSVQYLARLLQEETEKLGGAARRVVLGGISQGGAVALWTLLCAGEGDVARRLGGFVGASTWLPFAEKLEWYLGGRDIAEDGEQLSESDAFVKAMTASARRGDSEVNRHQVPVFLAHGTDDAYVDVELGRQAADVFKKVGMQVSWTEYSGADEEGHWLKEPDEFDDIVKFLESISP